MPRPASRTQAGATERNVWRLDEQTYGGGWSSKRDASTRRTWLGVYSESEVRVTDRKM